MSQVFFFNLKPIFDHVNRVSPRVKSTRYRPRLLNMESINQLMMMIKWCCCFFYLGVKQG